MVMMIMGVNLLAVLIAALASIVLGAIWYSMPVFGKAWLKSIGKTKKDLKKMKKTAGRAYGVMIITALVMASVLAYVVAFTQASTLVEGASIGFWMWLGFIATTMIGAVTWEGKPFKWYLIGAGYQLISLAVMGAILAVWV